MQSIFATVSNFITNLVSPDCLQLRLEIQNCRKIKDDGEVFMEPWGSYTGESSLIETNSCCNCTVTVVVTEGMRIWVEEVAIRLNEYIYTLDPYVSSTLSDTVFVLDKNVLAEGVIEYEFSVPFHLLFTKNVESKAGVAAPHVPVPGVATISGGGETSRNVGTSCRKILYKVDGNGRILSNTQEGMDVEIRYTSDSSASIHSHRIIPSSASTDSTKVSAVGSSGIAQGLGLHPQSLYHDTYNGKSFAIRHTLESRLSIMPSWGNWSMELFDRVLYTPVHLLTLCGTISGFDGNNSLSLGDNSCGSVCVTLPAPLSHPTSSAKDTNQSDTLNSCRSNVEQPNVVLSTLRRIFDLSGDVQTTARSLQHIEYVMGQDAVGFTLAGKLDISSLQIPIVSAQILLIERETISGDNSNDTVLLSHTLFGDDITKMEEEIISVNPHVCCSRGFVGRENYYNNEAKTSGKDMPEEGNDPVVSGAMFDFFIPCVVLSVIDEKLAGDCSPDISLSVMDRNISSASSVKSDPSDISTDAPSSIRRVTPPSFSIQPSFVMTAVNSHKDPSSISCNSDNVDGSANLPNGEMDVERSMQIERNGPIEEKLALSDETSVTMASVLSCRHFLRLLVCDINGLSSWNSIEVFFYRQSIRQRENSSEGMV